MTDQYTDGTDGWIHEWGDLVDAIRGLQPGDVVRVRTEPTTMPNVALRVVDDSERPTPLGEAAPAVDDDGTPYTLEPTWEHRGDENPWLRQGGKSAGSIGAIQVKKDQGGPSNTDTDQ